MSGRGGKSLTEAQAWREIARRVACRGLRASGLCYEIMVAEGVAGRVAWHPTEHASVVSRAVGDAMHARLQRHLDGASFIASDFGQHENVRVLAALFLALEAEDDS